MFNLHAISNSTDYKLPELFDHFDFWHLHENQQKRETREMNVTGQTRLKKIKVQTKQVFRSSNLVTDLV